jgi:hypothetical protein
MSSPVFQIGQPNGSPVRAASAEVVTKFVSHMPIVAPGDVDRKMPVKAPDPGTDYGLAVKTPGVEPAE